MAKINSVELLVLWINEYESNTGYVFVETLLQRRPNTAVRICVRHQDASLGIGFSKCNSEDKWDPKHEIDLAVKKALPQIVRGVLASQ